MQNILLCMNFRMIKSTITFFQKPHFFLSAVNMMRGTYYMLVIT